MRNWLFTCGAFVVVFGCLSLGATHAGAEGGAAKHVNLSDRGTPFSFPLAGIDLTFSKSGGHPRWALNLKAAPAAGIQKFCALYSTSLDELERILARVRSPETTVIQCSSTTNHAAAKIPQVYIDLSALDANDTFTIFSNP